MTTEKVYVLIIFAIILALVLGFVVLWAMQYSDLPPALPDESSFVYPNVPEE